MTIVVKFNDVTRNDTGTFYPYINYLTYQVSSVFTRNSLKGVRTMPFYCTLELLKPMILEHYRFS